MNPTSYQTAPPAARSLALPAQWTAQAKALLAVTLPRLSPAASLHDGTSNQLSLNLIGTFANDHEWCVAKVTLYSKLRRITAAATDTNSIHRDLHRHLGGEELRHARFEVASFASVNAASSIEHEQPGCRQFGHHVCEVIRDGLMVPDRYAERLSFLGVRERILVRSSPASEGSRSDLDPAGLEPQHHLR